MDITLNNETALVTGAGQGMGRKIAEQLAESGADVILNDIVEEEIEVVEDVINEGDGGDAVAITADVTDYDDVGIMVEAADEQFGGVDILVNNAGAWVTERFTETTPDQWDKDIELNLYGVLNCIHHVLPGMVKREHGNILSIVSDAGRVGEPRLAPYAAAKAGVQAFTRSIAKEAGEYGVRANCIAMGTTETSATEDMLAEGRKERVLGEYLLDRLGRPEDAANAVCFLASDAASWVTGQTIPINGGYTTF